MSEIGRNMESVPQTLRADVTVDEQASQPTSEPAPACEAEPGAAVATRAMEVFLVPVGSRYSLYCEASPESESDTQTPSGGIVARLAHRVGAWLAAEERGMRTSAPGTPPTWRRRVRRWAVRWLTNVAAEQRLLWHLRRQDEAVLFHPADLEEPDATALLRAGLRRDGDRHRRWLIFDAVALIVSAVLAIVPGPNLLAYYFAFRVVGHYLSLRGVRQGLDRVRWRPMASVPLTDLRDVTRLAPAARRARVAEVAARLGLPDLPAFFERIRVPGA